MRVWCSTTVGCYGNYSIFRVTCAIRRYVFFFLVFFFHIRIIYHCLLPLLLRSCSIHIISIAFHTRRTPLLFGLRREVIILLDDIRRHRSTSLRHRRFKMCTGNMWNRIRQSIGFFLRKILRLDSLLSLNLSRDGIPDSILCRPLANFGNIGTRKSVRHIRELLERYIFVYRTLTQIRLKDRDTRFPIREGNVDKLVETSRTHYTGIENIRTVRRSDNEQRFPRPDTIDFGEELIDDTVTRL
mmetsp:Transcript_21250/g.25287  ORF Transcript_21250/g.25287 Transcript_21250/m.25287 type:complete len:242 (-) Transcript_21250:139-864(-)